MVKYFWSSWIWKTHLSKFWKKIKKTKLIEAKKINDEIIEDLKNLDCLIIDDYDNNIDENSFILFLINLDN